MTTAAAVDVVAVGEAMGLLDPDGDGPLEDAAHLSLRVAGAEANVLIVLARLGRTTALVSAVGNDPVGRLVLRTLTEQGVDVGHIHVDETARTGIFFKERFADGLRRVYYYRDGSAASQLSAAVAAVHEMPTPQVLVLSGLSLGLGAPGGLASVARDAVRHFKASGATVVFDPNLRPRLWDGSQAAEDFAEVGKDIDILVAGHDELPVLVPGRSAEQAAHELCANGMRAVVVKNGPHGAVLVEGSGRTEIPPFRVERVVDPVGAGDAFAAGVVCGLLQDWPLLDSARLGAMLGACAVTSSGDWEAVPAGEPPRQLLERYLTRAGPVGERT